VLPSTAIPNEVGQFSFEYGPQSHKTSSGIYHGSTLGSWLVTPPLLCYFSHFHSLSVQLLVPPLFSEAGSTFYPNPIVGVRLQFAVYAFQFCF
jgi:hypothetical protein